VLDPFRHRIVASLCQETSARTCVKIPTAATYDSRLLFPRISEGCISAIEARSLREFGVNTAADINRGCWLCCVLRARGEEQGAGERRSVSNSILTKWDSSLSLSLSLCVSLPPYRYLGKRAHEAHLSSALGSRGGRTKRALPMSPGETIKIVVNSAIFFMSSPPPPPSLTRKLVLDHRRRGPIAIAGPKHGPGERKKVFYLPRGWDAST